MQNSEYMRSETIFWDNKHLVSQSHLQNKEIDKKNVKKS